LSIDVDTGNGQDGFVPGFLHLPPDFTTAPGTLPTHHHRTAAILLSGAGGGVTGPSSIYLSLACKLATVGIPTLRLDYRFPARTAACVADAKAAMAYLRDMYGLDRFVLVGWSFGGAVVFSAADGDERVVGCATVASQTAGTEGIRRLAPRPVLLMHGTGDRTLSDGCSRRLFEMYGANPKGERRLQLFEGDNHALSKNAERAEEMLCEFVASCAGVGIGEEERERVVRLELIEDGERHGLMEKGGDLREPEKED
jgi:pimeloyl-ACP methyl ester carboxylesterase